MLWREAADLFSTPWSCTAALAPAAELLPLCRVRPQTQQEGSGTCQRYHQDVPWLRQSWMQVESCTRPRLHVSGHFLSQDFQLRGLVTHDELSDVETVTERSSRCGHG